MLRSIVRVCLRSGVSAGEVRALLEHAFVHEAAAHLAERGERASLVNISAITGIARQTARALLETDPDRVAPRSDTQVHRAVRVLRGWHEDPEFTNANGAARDLPISGSGCTFESLARRYSGGVTYQSVLERLVTDGAAEVTRHDADRLHRVRALRVDLRPELGSSAAIEQLAIILADALDATAPAAPDANTEVAHGTVAISAPANSAHVVRARLRKRREIVMQSIEDMLGDVAMTPEQLADPAAQQGAVDVRVSILISARPRRSSGTSMQPPSDARVRSKGTRRPDRPDDASRSD